MLNRFVTPSTLLLLGVWAVSQFACDVGAQDSIDFNRDIRPLLSDACFQCHGPDANTRQADLRLDLESKAHENAIVAGEPESSELVERIFSDASDLQMPPPDSGLELTGNQKQTLKSWVAQGAKYQKHWSFEPIKRPQLPASTENLDDVHPIDAFVASRLIDSGIKPLGLAQPETQLRRVSLDLTGLPPTIEETDKFLAAVDTVGIAVAFENAVDRLLASQRFGERMAWQWLEAARYADTDGYQNDGPREMWQWRKWVIDAYNQNMPFDQFTIQQLAGDLLPNPTHEQLIATAFNRNHRYNSESGIPIDEFLLENAVDRVDTTSTVWLGLTLGCARCHDHKYDPLSQKEYYQLVDYFNDVDESGRAIKFGNSEPWIKTPTQAQRKRLEKLDQQVTAAESALKNAESEIAAAETKWFDTIVESDEFPNPVLNDGLEKYYGFDTDADNVKVKSGKPVLRESLFGKAATVGGNGSFVIDAISGLIPDRRFSIAFWLKADDVSSGTILSSEAKATTRKGNLIEFVDGHLRWYTITRWIAGVGSVETVDTIEPDQWVHVVLTNDGTQRAKGMQIYVDGELQAVSIAHNTNSNKGATKGNQIFEIGNGSHTGFWKGQLDELRFYPNRTLSQHEARLLSTKETIKEIGNLDPSDRTELQSQWLRMAYLENISENAHSKLLIDLRIANAARQTLQDSIGTTMVMQDLPAGRPSHVRLRGVYDQLGEKVSPGVPSVLPTMAQSAKNDRLELARWLVNGENPLTARVTVNRYWQMLFGRGLVNTAEDFGSQGELPTHPELLDWLASKFMDSDWDIKQTLKTIVMSETYRRDSQVTPESLKLDPGNQWYGRASRLRLPGNVLRDQALFASGLLVEKIGGPSVYPYQPKGLWREASNSTYKEGSGEDLYRRSVYTYWKRTLSPPTMALLDTADREWCSVKPKRTNTPLQALTLLNDVTFTESARVLAERLLESASKDESEESDLKLIENAFRALTARRPSLLELTLLSSALDEYRVQYQADPKLAQAALTIGKSPKSKTADAVELASMTALLNVLLNLDEVSTRE